MFVSGSRARRSVQAACTRPSWSTASEGRSSTRSKPGKSSTCTLAAERAPAVVGAREEDVPVVAAEVRPRHVDLPARGGDRRAPLVVEVRGQGHRRAGVDAHVRREAAAIGAARRVDVLERQRLRPPVALVDPGQHRRRPVVGHLGEPLAALVGVVHARVGAAPAALLVEAGEHHAAALVAAPVGQLLPRDGHLTGARRHRGEHLGDRAGGVVAHPHRLVEVLPWLRLTAMKTFARPSPCSCQTAYT